jgi:hypothetical protein
MAIIKIREQAHLRTGSLAYGASGESVRVFLAYSDSSTDDEGSIFAVAGSSSPGPDILPQIGTSHPTRPTLYLQAYACRNTAKDGLIWEITCAYSIFTPQPWNEPATYAWSTQTVEIVRDRDLKTGKAIVNSAGVPFEPALTAPYPTATLTVSQNLLSFNMFNYLPFVGAVNSEPYYGCPPGYVLCTGINPSESIANIGDTEQHYWQVSYQFAFNFLDGWQPLVMDAGYTKLNDANKLVPITIAGREPSQPVPLKNGKPIAAGDEPTFLRFNVYRSMPFSQLGV